MEGQHLTNWQKPYVMELSTRSQMVTAVANPCTTAPVKSAAAELCKHWPGSPPQPFYH